MLPERNVSIDDLKKLVKMTKDLKGVGQEIVQSFPVWFLQALQSMTISHEVEELFCVVAIKNYRGEAKLEIQFHSENDAVSIITGIIKLPQKLAIWYSFVSRVFDLDGVNLFYDLILEYKQVDVYGLPDTVEFLINAQGEEYVTEEFKTKRGYIAGLLNTALKETGYRSSYIEDATIAFELI